MSRDDFGALLRKYRRQTTDPQHGGGLTQDRLADYLSEELGFTYSRGAISEWERGRSQIHKDDRNLIISLIKVLHQHKGIDALEQANEWLAAGNYRPLDQNECQLISSGWKFEPAQAPIAPPQPQSSLADMFEFPTQPRPQEQQFLLHKVKTFWVEGVLEKSLHGEVLIELGKEARPQALEYPWEMVVQPVDQQPFTLPPDKTIVEVFQEANKSLLILGAPGSGKTTMLLELAQALISDAEQNPLSSVPVIFNLSSWTGDKSIVAWLVDELSQKYFIPKKFSQPWIEDDKLLLLLDGLDEVDPKYQQSCVEAINAFRQDHLAGMVVCSRAADYEAITKKLKLESAIFLQPLTQEQIDTYLGMNDKGLEAVRSILRKDAGFEELARSPLMLSIMTLAYQGISIEELIKMDSTDDRRQYLFATYVQQMFKRRGVSTSYSVEQTIQWLSWLANGMYENDSTVFFLEFLQPSWLSTRFQRWAYLLVTRMLGGFFIGIILWLNLLIGRFVGWSFQQDLAKRMSEILQINESASVFIFPVIFSMALGLIVAAFHIVVYERDEGSTAVKNSATRWRRSFTVGLLVSFLTVAAFALFGGFLRAEVLAFALWEGIAFIIASQYVYGTTFRDDISTTENISWSREDAVKGMVSGLAIGAIITLSPILDPVQSYDVTFSNVLGFGLLFWLLGQVRRESIVDKNRPNQGIWLSAKNGFKIGLIFGLSFSVFYLVLALILEWSFILVAVGGIIGVLVALLIYGSLNVINHFFLRFLLLVDGAVPWHVVRFLDHADDRIFLRRVGGGYIFVHRALLEYFANINPRH